jgi:hypothetical protein
MKKFFNLLVLVFISGAVLQAQDAEDRIESLKIAFITEKLSLSPEESQQFWPIYNEYTSKRDALRKNVKPEKPVEQMSEQEAQRFLTGFLDQEQQQLDLKRDYMLRLQNVLPAKKVAMLGTAERQFKEKLLERIKRRQGRGRPRGN